MLDGLRPGRGAMLSHAIGWVPWSCAYLTFGDIEGKLDMLPRRVHQVRPQGTLQRGEADREARTQWKSDGVARDANADCPKRDARIQNRCDLVCPYLPQVI
jgi:hypothetical protein